MKLPVFSYEQDVVATYWGWHNLSQKSPDDYGVAGGVLDFKMVNDPHIKEFTDLGHVKGAINRHREQLPDDALNRDEVAQRLEASMSYLDVLSGQRAIDLDYIRTITGLEPGLVQTKEIEAQSRVGEALLAQMGLSKDDFEATAVINSKPDIEGAIVDGQQMAANFFARLGIPQPDLTIDTRYVEDEKRNYSGFASTDEKGNLFIEYNISPFAKPTRGNMMMTAVHEGTHCVNEALRFQAAVTEPVGTSFIYGATTFHDPLTVQSESLTAASENMVAAQALDLQASLEVSRANLKNMVYNNAGYKIIIGEDPQAVAAEAAALMPLEPAAKVEKNVIDMAQDPTWLGIMMSYYPAFRIAKKLMRLVDETGSASKHVELYSMVQAPSKINADLDVILSA